MQRRWISTPQRVLLSKHCNCSGHTTTSSAVLHYRPTLNCPAGARLSVWIAKLVVNVTLINMRRPRAIASHPRKTSTTAWPVIISRDVTYSIVWRPAGDRHQPQLICQTCVTTLRFARRRHQFHVARVSYRPCWMTTLLANCFRRLCLSYQSADKA